MAKTFLLSFTIQCTWLMSAEGTRDRHGEPLSTLLHLHGENKKLTLPWTAEIAAFTCQHPLDTGKSNAIGCGDNRTTSTTWSQCFRCPTSSAAAAGICHCHPSSCCKHPPHLNVLKSLFKTREIILMFHQE